MNETKEGEKRRGTEKETGSRDTNIDRKEVETRNDDDSDLARKRIKKNKARVSPLIKLKNARNEEARIEKHEVDTRMQIARK